jgi:hypothetical protein
MHNTANLPIPLAKVRGMIIAARLAFVEQHWGRESKDYLINKISFRERRQLESIFFENHWFSLNTLAQIDHTITTELARGNKTILHQLGRFSAEYNISHFPVTLKALSPIEMLKNAARFNVLLQDFGEIKFELLSESSERLGVALIYQYRMEVPLSYCLSAIGYFERLIELLGYKVIKVVEQPHDSQDNFTHRYEIWWQPTIILADTPVIAITPRKNHNLATPLQVAGVKPTEIKTITITPKKKKMLRLKILSLLILITSIYSLADWVLSTAVTEAETTSYYYKCEGALNLELKLDLPYLVLKPLEEWENTKISMQEEGKTYFYQMGSTMINGKFEIGLGEFLDTNNNALNLVAAPKILSINAQVGEESRSSLCQWIKD